MDEPTLLVEPCDACRRHIRRSAARCPFCDAPHEAKPIRYRALARTRVALAGGALLMAAACGTPEGEASGGGGDHVEGTGGGEGGGGGESGDGAPGGGMGDEEAEVSCAGRCGSHHQIHCDDDGNNCVAPPYGAPPADELV